MTKTFENCTLFASARSPFARRVRLAFLETGLPFQLKLLDVLKPNAELITINPLGRVPTVVLESGDVLVESNLILQAYYRKYPSSFFPVDSHQEAFELYHWMGLATGIMDRSLEYFFESMRPQEQRDREWLDEIALVTGKTFEKFESHLERYPFLVGNQITQADLDLGIAMEYFSLRVNSLWEKNFPQIAKKIEQMRSQKNFEFTRPPQ